MHVYMYVFSTCVIRSSLSKNARGLSYPPAGRVFYIYVLRAETVTIAHILVHKIIVARKEKHMLNWTIHSFHSFSSSWDCGNPLKL
jgi:hypothetical protein